MRALPRRVRVRRSLYGAWLPVLIALAAVPAPAAGFGTIDTLHLLGQGGEHELITRAALECHGGEPRPGCFDPLSTDELAGNNFDFGAVGAPDIPPPEGPRSHCDDADYFDDPDSDKGYPRGSSASGVTARDVATATLRACVDKMRGDFEKAIKRAGSVLYSDRDVLRPDQVESSSITSCETRADGDVRAKCRALNWFGRALHGVQDFYSHSNWTDTPVPEEEQSIRNPPGLGRSGLPAFLQLTSGAGFSVDRDLTTGCYTHLSDVTDKDKPGSPCHGRVRHRFIAKDTPGKIRSHGSNFFNAVAAAVQDTRRQWQDLRSALIDEYGDTRGNLIACALERDEAVDYCQSRDIAIVVDRSSSHQKSDEDNRRVDAAKELNEELIDANEAAVPGGKPDRSAVISFDDRGQVVSSLGDPAQADFSSIDSEGMATVIASGVETAIDELTRDENPVKDRAGIVVFTDGKDMEPELLTAALARAKGLGIKVAFGFVSPPRIPVRARRLESAQADSQPHSVHAAILETGGVFADIDSPAAQHAFTALLTRTGLTNRTDPNGPDDDGAIGPEFSIMASLSGPADVDRFTYQAPAGRSLAVTVDPADGDKPALRLTGSSVEDLRRLPRAFESDDGWASIDTTTRRAGQLVFEVSGRRGATGLYHIRVFVEGVDVRGSKRRDRLGCPRAPSAGFSPMQTPSAHVLALAGNDRVVCEDADDVIVGGKGADVLLGRGGDDTFLIGRKDVTRGVETIDGGPHRPHRAKRDVVEIAIPKPRRLVKKGGTTVIRIGRGVLRIRNVERLEFTGVRKVPKRDLPGKSSPGSGGAHVDR